MRSPWTKYFKKKVAEAAAILLAIKVPRHAVRWAATINAKRDGPTASGNCERQAPFAIKDFDERGHPVGPRQGVWRGQAQLRLMGTRCNQRPHARNRLMRQGWRGRHRGDETASSHRASVNAPSLPREASCGGVIKHSLRRQLDNPQHSNCWDCLDPLLLVVGALRGGILRRPTDLQPVVGLRFVHMKRHFRLVI